MVCPTCNSAVEVDDSKLTIHCGCWFDDESNQPAVQAEGAQTLTTHGTPSPVQDPVLRHCEDRVTVDIPLAIDSYHSEARACEAFVADDLRLIVEEENGAFRGLEFRLKAHDSLSRKVNDRLSTGKAIKRGTAITDALRFTIVFPPDGWGPNVQGVLWNIQGKGYAILDEENSWGNGDC